MTERDDAALPDWIREIIYERFRATVEEPVPGLVSVGRVTYADPSVFVKAWHETETIRIGSWCSFAMRVSLIHSGGNSYLDSAGEAVSKRFHYDHRPECAMSFPLGIFAAGPFFEDRPTDGSVMSKPMVIGNDVWLGFGSTVVGGVTVSDGAVIAAGSVVMTDIPPYAVVAGNPARVVRYRFSPRTIERLLSLQWWDWPVEEIVRYATFFTGPIEDFLARFDPAGEAG